MESETARLISLLMLTEVMFRIPCQLEPYQFAKLAVAMKKIGAEWKKERQAFVMGVAVPIEDLLKKGETHG